MSGDGKLTLLLQFCAGSLPNVGENWSETAEYPVQKTLVISFFVGDIDSICRGQGCHNRSGFKRRHHERRRQIGRDTFNGNFDSIAFQAKNATELSKSSHSSHYDSRIKIFKTHLYQNIILQSESSHISTMNEIILIINSLNKGKYRSQRKT